MTDLNLSPAKQALLEIKSLRARVAEFGARYARAQERVARPQRAGEELALHRGHPGRGGSPAGKVDQIHMT